MQIALFLPRQQNFPRIVFGRANDLRKFGGIGTF
jgi:hypothetical protein